MVTRAHNPARLVRLTFPIHILMKTRLYLARLKQYPKASRPEYHERLANLKHFKQPCYTFCRISSILWVVSMEMNEK